MTEYKKIFATPKVRRFARELGANVSLIEGTERKGRITEEDVKKFISKQLKEPENTKEYSQQVNKIKNEYNHSDFGEVEIKEIISLPIFPAAPITVVFILFIIF